MSENEEPKKVNEIKGPKDDLLKKAGKKEMLSKEDARDLITSWADILDIDPESDKFQDVIEAIQYSVRKEQLTFDSDNFSFNYTLKSPILKNDSKPISIVTISEMDMTQKKVVQKYKDSESIDQAVALMAESLNMGDKIGFVGRIKGRDSDIINAVIMGFFTGAGN
jgi:hypothetical protein